MPALSSRMQKNRNTSILAEIRAYDLRCFLTAQTSGKPNSNDRLLCVIIQISWVTHHQNHPRLPMRWGVPCRKMAHLGGCVLIHISAILAEIWITSSITANSWAAAMTVGCGVPCPTSCGICLVVTNLSLKSDQLLAVFRLIERLWRTSDLFLRKRNKTGGCRWNRHWKK